MSFGEKECNPLPPFFHLSAPYEDTVCKDKKGKDILTTKGKQKFEKGYAGKAKGIAQVLWERGLYKKP